MWRNCDVHTLLVGNVKWSALWKTVWQFLKMSNIELPHNPAIPFLGIYSKELKTGNPNRNWHTNIYSSIKHPKYT